ncbi:MAG TPA: glutaminyl-peptide cyclotransferase [Candidatus Kapabacteria bacterium]|jgi:glutamine cyclotransferase|nr:glutaminyl-peptide cyclotransferase [Candidatus Kapabacteria bacterium]HOM04250.1 glutaminyl-peptide cyclotransferase [Candidatus Kapabacteria bacterium]HOQ49366.1 glutaminyl-peptide cyclotransferase [Candidatus Kapabacteria bacterium]HPU22995.1 glutaminyl-peptide cyclotransferase [Candidatus Kapabacteria bacterium]
MRINAILLILLAFLASCKQEQKQKYEFQYINQANSAANTDSTIYYTVKIIRQFPHNREFYTQGLLYHDGFLYESTGQHGHSALYKIDPQSGKVITKATLPDDKFGEGIAVWKNKIYQITWLENTCYVYDAKSLKLERTLRYNGEGWGLVADGDRLIMSDGSFVLKYINPQDFSQIGTKQVHYLNGRQVYNINELEFDGEGYLYANIWQEDKIVKIDTAAGKVVGIIDISPLREIVVRGGAPEVSNGIAFIPQSRTFILTGKYWHSYFEVEFVKK